MNTTVDLATMRESVSLLLDIEGAPVAEPPSGTELVTLTATLRGHLELIISEVEAEAAQLGGENTLVHAARTCVWEARSRLAAEPSRRYGGEAGHARRLARVLKLLCDHYEVLGGRP
ncbi:DUF6415 family natural product biosynthesis protein [Streptomyces sp. NL15-2K]|uniref:DUF6415 family natural product biosynthesis protein n=1 Tax=Streptomyces sp. NL15-2K TaxID=376149 RepID=UPI000F57BB73|nr:MULTISPECIES: DUF6415 family natural product biosynthesis protein [Actinomycetes]WKX10167.1 DUF6415 family natural product biosynthesis protein [Kutzneria buriramensis]